MYTNARNVASLQARLKLNGIQHHEQSLIERLWDETVGQCDYHSIAEKIIEEIEDVAKQTIENHKDQIPPDLLDTYQSVLESEPMFFSDEMSLSIETMLLDLGTRMQKAFEVAVLDDIQERERVISTAVV